MNTLYNPDPWFLLHATLADDQYWYVAGPMRGFPQFNFPAFYEAEQILRDHGVLFVFNPARRDNELHGELNSPNGDISDVPQFSLRESLEADTSWICRHATHILLLPGYSRSKGAMAEMALAEALGIEVVLYTGWAEETEAELSAYQDGFTWGTRTFEAEDPDVGC